MSILVIDETQRAADYSKLMPSFESQAQVEHYFGTESKEAKLTAELFAQNPSAEIQFIRAPSKQRPHLIGKDLSGESLSDLQAISGTFEIDFQTSLSEPWKYNIPDLSFANCSSIDSMAQTLSTELSLSRQPIAKFEATITPQQDYFEGEFTRNSTIQVNQWLSGEAAPVGAIIDYGANLTLGTIGDQTIGETDGEYHNYAKIRQNNNVMSPEEMGMSWGVLTVPDSECANCAIGEQVLGSGVLPHTYIEGRLSQNEFIVNEAQSFSGTLTLLPTQLQAVPNGNNHTIAGSFQADLTIAPVGWSGLDFENQSTLSFASGTAATELGLTQDSAFAASLQGGMNVHWADYLSLLQQEVGFSSIYDFSAVGPGVLAWAESHGIGVSEATKMTERH